MSRIANHQIDSHVKTLTPFVNYNATIQAREGVTAERTYEVWHWSTKMLSFNVETNRIEHLASWYISQTSSALVGRLLRNLPAEAVDAYLESIRFERGGDFKRLSRMVRR